MLRRGAYLAALSVATFMTAAPMLSAEFKPVTADVLLNPDPADWLMINRTYDEQRFSPLNQVNREQCRRSSHGVDPRHAAGNPGIDADGLHDGVMYVIAPGGGVQALDATSGDLVWEYWRTYPKDMTKYDPRRHAVARQEPRDVRGHGLFRRRRRLSWSRSTRSTGKVRWETKAHDYTKGTEHTGGLMVADGKVISNRTCTQRDGCFIAAHDAKTGQEVWKFYNTASPDEPGGDTWGGLAPEKRSASSWGLPGSYDPKSARCCTGRSPIRRRTPG